MADDDDASGMRGDAVQDVAVRRHLLHLYSRSLADGQSRRRLLTRVAELEREVAELRGGQREQQHHQQQHQHHLPHQHHQEIIHGGASSASSASAASASATNNAEARTTCRHQPQQTAPKTLSSHHTSSSAIPFRTPDRRRVLKNLLTSDGTHHADDPPRPPFNPATTAACRHEGGQWQPVVPPLGEHHLHTPPPPLDPAAELVCIRESLPASYHEKQHLTPIDPSGGTIVLPPVPTRQLGPDGVSQACPQEPEVPEFSSQKWDPATNFLVNQDMTDFSTCSQHAPAASNRKADLHGRHPSSPHHLISAQVSSTTSTASSDEDIFQPPSPSEFLEKLQEVQTELAERVKHVLGRGI